MINEAMKIMLGKKSPRIMISHIHYGIYKGYLQYIFCNFKTTF